MSLTLEKAQEIILTVLSEGNASGFKPLTVAVLDAGGHLKAMARSDGTSTLRPKMAHGKAHGCIALGLGGRAIYKRAQEQPYFIQAMNSLADGALVPVQGGVFNSRWLRHHRCGWRHRRYIRERRSLCHCRD